MDSQYDTSSSIILEAYLHDFVSMSHHYTTLSEHKVNRPHLQVLI